LNKSNILLTAPNRENSPIIHPEPSSRSFTLLELIIVIIIVGILATLGLSTYTNQLEYARTAEARANVGAMRKLAYEYYLKNGSLDNIQRSDVGVDYTCTSTNFYRYTRGNYTTYVSLIAERCTRSGKTPNASRRYYYYLRYYPGTGQSTWYCYYTDNGSSCFGLPTGP